MVVLRLSYGAIRNRPAAFRSSLASVGSIGARTGGSGRSGSLQNIIFERHAFRIVLVQSRLAGFLAREDFKVIDVANFLADIDVNPDGHWSS
jgi:hypothetical protein